MFENPFSPKGRIHRTEYVLSIIISVAMVILLHILLDLTQGNMPMLGLGYIPLCWFIWTQNAKRCHDLGKNGWWQLMPGYIVCLVFLAGQNNQDNSKNT